MPHRHDDFLAPWLSIDIVLQLWRTPSGASVSGRRWQFPPSYAHIRGKEKGNIMEDGSRASTSVISLEYWTVEIHLAPHDQIATVSIFSTSI